MDQAERCGRERKVGPDLDSILLAGFCVPRRPDWVGPYLDFRHIKRRLRAQSSRTMIEGLTDVDPLHTR